MALGDLCEIVIGRTPARDRADYWGMGHPWLSIADMSQGTDITRTKEQITQKAVEKAKPRIVQPGTVLLSFKLSIGKVGIAQMPLYTNEAIAALPIRDGVSLDAAYLSWALRSLRLAQGGDRAALGTTLNKAKLLAIPIVMPPLAEQRRIAAILDAADALRAKRRVTIAALDTLTQSIFLDMFGDCAQFDPLPLSTVADVRGGLTVNAKRSALPIRAPYLRVANVARGMVNVEEVKTIGVTEAELQRLALEPDDLLLVEGHGNRAEVGRVARWIGSFAGCVHQNHLIRIRLDDRLAIPVFAEHYLNGRGGRTQIASVAKTTSGLNTISIAQVRALTVPIPPLQEQLEFAERAAAAVDSLEPVQTSKKQLDVLFSSLQSRAFHGEL